MSITVNLDEHSKKRATTYKCLSSLLPILNVSLSLFSRDRVDLDKIKNLIHEVQQELEGIIHEEIDNRAQARPSPRRAMVTDFSLPTGGRLKPEFIEGSTKDGTGLPLQHSRVMEA